MTMHQRAPSSYDANVSIPESLTDHLIQGILALNCQSSKVKYLQSEFLTKFVSSDTDPSITRRTRAINKWLATERINEGTNDRLLTMCEEYRILPHISYRRFMDKCREVIISIVGEIPPWEAFIGSFSGGASTSRGRTCSFPANKYLGRADVTAPALSYFEGLLEDMPGWASFRDEFSVNVVAGNVLFTVPKNTTIDRCACKEPDINMFLQKGLGGEIRRCLRRVGVNLNDQSVNRRLAKLGSETGKLATLDLSSASDSISRQLVFELMPPIWFASLDALRSPITIIDGEEHVNEMFSSMGNGFTFELESLLFYAIARTVAFFEGIPGVISVYGDDIICPVYVADMLTWVLGVLGFEVNTKKSFSSGSFRESCGGHYDGGCDITPFYLRKPMSRLTDLIHMANSLRRWSDIGIGICVEDIYDLWVSLSSHIPKRFWGGRDLSSITQLVSPGLPRDKLVERVKVQRLDAGAYIHWLNTTWVRENAGQEAIETSLLSRPMLKYRPRPAAKADVIPLSPLFLEEL